MRSGGFRFAVALGGLLWVPAAGAEEQWLEVRSPHFVVVTDAGEKPGREIANGFEQLRRLFQALGDLRVDPAAPIVIVATRDAGGMRALLPEYWKRHGALQPAGVAFSSTGADKHHIVMRLDVPPDLRDNVVYHEYTHLVARLNFPSLPLWLNEGLAEFYATTMVRGDKIRFGRVDARHLAELRRRSPLPLVDLFAIEAGSPEYNEAHRATVLYAQSALLTHFFLIGDKGAHRSQLVAYLRLRTEGASDDRAQAQAFGNLKALQKSFSRYLRQKEFLAIESPLDLSAAAAAVHTLGEAEVLTLRGELHVRHGRNEDAGPLLTKARQVDPGLAAAAQALGLMELTAGRPAEARRALADAIRLAPDDFASHFLWALAMPPEAPDHSATEAALRRALQLNPSFAPAHALLSNVLQADGRLEPAFASLVKACELEPTQELYWAQRADLLREMKRPDVAEKIEARLAEMAPSNPDQLASLGVYYRGKRRGDEFERLLRKAADVNPRSALAPMMLGLLLREADRADEAEAAFRRALAAQPDNPSLLNLLAYHNADRGVKLPEALKLVERGLSTYPHDATMLDTKGWTLFRMGRLDEAERYLRQSLARGDDPEVLEHLGDVLLARRQKAAAEEMWKRALDHADVKDARKAELRRKLGVS